MSSIGILVLAGATLGQGGDYYSSATAASRELAKQLDYLQRSFASIPGPPEGRGLYQQADQIQYAVLYLQQQLKQKAGKEDLMLAFDKVDGKLNTLLDDIQGFSKWVPAVKMTSRQVRSAQHDLHFALTTGGTSATPAQQAYRQTLVLQTRVEELENMVVFVFDETDDLPAWKAGFKNLRGTIVRLQKLQNAKVARDEVRASLAQINQAWQKLVDKFAALPDGQNVLLRNDFAKVDQVMGRLAALFGVDRRPALQSNDGN